MRTAMRSRLVQHLLFIVRKIWSYLTTQAASADGYWIVLGEGDDGVSDDELERK